MTIKVIDPEKVSRFRVRGEAKLTAGITVAMHIKNISEARDLVIDKITHQLITPGISGYPNIANYFRIATGRTFNLGGTLVEPINIDDDRKAPVTIYEADPFLEGEEFEIDRIYIDKVGFGPVWEDRLVLGPLETAEISVVGVEQGLISTRVYFNA